MSSYNKVIIIGNLGQDPDIRMTQGGKQTCTLSIATSESWVRDGKKEERTEWHRVVLWEKLAELAGKYLKKGNKVLIEGKLQTRSWDQDGQKRYATEVIAHEMKFMPSGGGNGNRAGSTQQSSNGWYNPSGSNGSMGSDFSEEDVPF